MMVASSSQDGHGLWGRKADYNCFDLQNSMVVSQYPWGLVPGARGYPNPQMLKSLIEKGVVQSALRIRGSTSTDSTNLQNSICGWLNRRSQNLRMWRADCDSQVWASRKKMTLSDAVVLPRWCPFSEDSKKRAGPCDCEALCKGDSVWQVTEGVRPCLAKVIKLLH